jgi:hypothetical protein
MLRRLPIPDYVKTRLWSTGLPRPLDDMPAWPYYRCIDVAIRAMARPDPARGELILDRASNYSMLEFGVATGESFRKMLHFRDVCQRKYRLDNTITCVGFDTFDGMPAARSGDSALIWKAGDLPSDDSELQRALEPSFRGFRLVKGLFGDTLDVVMQDFLRANPPVFVSLDCDYYSSTMDVLSVLLPTLVPNGALFYFDDVGVNFYSERTGQLKAIAEVNAGCFGRDIELIEYPLWIETRELRHWKLVYRLFNRGAAEAYQQSVLATRSLKQILARRRDLSPL